MDGEKQHGATGPTPDIDEMPQRQEHKDHAELAELVYANLGERNIRDQHRTDHSSDGQCKGSCGCGTKASLDIGTAAVG